METATKRFGHPDVALDEVERTVGALLRGYADALRYAADMPAIGRSRVSGTRLKRWGARFFTRVYVETHVRKHLEAIRGTLRLQRTYRTSKEERARLGALEELLGQHLEPLFRWRRAVNVIAGLPPVAAALPIISAALAWPLADVSARTLFYALLVLVGTWLLVVWPSIRLGFRVKRVILAGGRDLLHPFANRSDYREWEGFRAPSFYDERASAEAAADDNDRAVKEPREVMPLPTLNVYKAENDVYRALGRRKPAEIPLDLVLGLAPYLWTAYSVFWFYGLADTIVDGELGEALADSAFGVFVGGLLAVAVIGFPLDGRRSYRTRPH